VRRRQASTPSSAQRAALGSARYHRPQRTTDELALEVRSL